ncbi:MAG TPA: hypothetical protein VKE96_15280, partial [Vicinamibacterales bacterium]|nr:hypothetical protein [Vicinamibacterales bacterium]
GRQYRNLVTVFFLCGLWHGASWNFVIWGLWHGVFLVVERVATGRRQSAHPESAISHPAAISREPSAIPVLSWPIWPHVYTMAVVMVGWVFFRAETLGGAVSFLEALAGVTPAAPTPYSVGWYLTPELWLALVAGAIGSTPWVPALAERVARQDRSGLTWGVPLVNTALLTALLVASILQLAARSYNPFIYFRF